MKKIFRTFIIIGLVASSTSCKKYLDVNTNENDITAATPELILPQALAATASVSQTFNITYGGDLGGYIANAGGVGSFGNFWTFVFNSGDFNGLWSNTFDNLQDYQFILNNTTATGPYKNYNAVARLMKAVDYLRLVDAYGDVPYTQALQGAAKVSPAYDKGADVYKACIAEIDAAVTQFKAANTATTVNLASSSVGKVDIMQYSSNTAKPALSGGGLDMTNWIRYANTVKLRALIRIQKADVATYNAAKASMATLTGNDFIAADILANPSYVQQAGKQNPLWNALNYTYTGTSSTKSYIPTKFVTAFYDGTKLTDGTKSGAVPADNGRGNLVMRDYTHSNQLGFQSTNSALQPSAPGSGSQWYVQKANYFPAATLTAYPSSGLAAEGYGIMKGFDMGQPIMTAAESYFLQAEGALIGLTPLAGTPATLFDNGITASYAYLDKDRNGLISNALFVPATQLATYKTSNPTSYLVNFALATTPAQQLEAIITQKYIALNMLNCDEGWNEYRRTLYPVSIPPSATANAASPTLSIAPNFITLATPRADGLAGRVLYPASEYSYNTANVPTVDVNTTLVFWDARPKN